MVSFCAAERYASFLEPKCCCFWATLQQRNRRNNSFEWINIWFINWLARSPGGKAWWDTNLKLCFFHSLSLPPALSLHVGLPSPYSCSIGRRGVVLVTAVTGCDIMLLLCGHRWCSMETLFTGNVSFCLCVLFCCVCIHVPWLNFLGPFL